MIPTIVVDAVAAYRLTKLVTDDTITEPVREAIIRWSYRNEVSDYEDAAVDSWTDLALVDTADGDAPRLATLVTCRWCAGVWIAAGVVVARRTVPRVWSPLAEVLAVAAGAALLARFED